MWIVIGTDFYSGKTHNWFLVLFLVQRIYLSFVLRTSVILSISWTLFLFRSCYNSWWPLPEVLLLSFSDHHHHTFQVQYELDTFPTEQLIRASFVHLRSSSSSNSRSSWALGPPRCTATVTSLGPQSLVTLEPHQQWTETDITAHVTTHMLQKKEQGGGHLTLRAQYRCTEPNSAGYNSTAWWWRQWSGLGGPVQLHVEVPSLLLYLEEQREGKEWMEELLGDQGRNIVKRMAGYSPLLRRRRSKDPSGPEKPLVEALKNTVITSSSTTTSPSSPITFTFPSMIKRKTSLQKNRCRLHSFRLSFSELGWGHYFIAPPVYNPRFCRGDCPRLLPYSYHSPNHAIIQTLINQMGVAEVPPPSCVPYSYMPMSVLVVHQKKVEYRELEDMVAQSCTCRWVGHKSDTLHGPRRSLEP